MRTIGYPMGSPAAMRREPPLDPPEDGPDREAVTQWLFETIKDESISSFADRLRQRAKRASVGDCRWLFAAIETLEAAVFAASEELLDLDQPLDGWF